MVECGILSTDCGSLEGYAWTSAQSCTLGAVDCVFCAGIFRVKTTMFIQIPKHRIGPPYQQGVRNVC